MSSGSTLTVAIEIDEDSAICNPADDYDEWTIYSFSTRHNNFRYPDEFLTIKFDAELARTNGSRAATTYAPKTVGLARKLACNTAFLLSYYEHGNCVWSLQGEGPQCQWDTTRCAGILLNERPKELPKDYEARAERARGFLRDYTEWCNGNVYGITISDSVDELDACWGFIGRDNALSMVEEMLRPHYRPGDTVVAAGLLEPYELNAIMEQGNNAISVA